MRKTTGGAQFVSARFKREKKQRAFASELDSLEEKVIRAANRLGVDLSDDKITDKLLKLSTTEMDDESDDSRDLAIYAERFLALAYAQTVIIHVSSTDVDIISALCLGNRLVGMLDGMPNTLPGPYKCIPCIIKEHSSKIGKAGVEKKLAPMRELERWAIAQYQAGEWPSANKAAHDLTEKVMAHGRSIGAILSEQNAQRTIAEWIRKAKKMSV